MRGVTKDRNAEENWVACAVCLNQSGKRVKMATIIKGYAVCEDHIDIVSAPGFDVYMLRTDRRKAL